MKGPTSAGSGLGRLAALGRTLGPSRAGRWRGGRFTPGVNDGGRGGGVRDDTRPSTHGRSTGAEGGPGAETTRPGAGRCSGQLGRRTQRGEQEIRNNTVGWRPSGGRVSRRAGPDGPAPDEEANAGGRVLVDAVTALCSHCMLLSGRGAGGRGARRGPRQHGPTSGVVGGMKRCTAAGGGMNWNDTAPGSAAGGGCVEVLPCRRARAPETRRAGGTSWPR